MIDPTPNLPLLRKVLEHVDAHPDEWNQHAWGMQTSRSACGTAFCIAGHAAVMAGLTPVWKRTGDETFMHSVVDADGNEVFVAYAAQDALGLTGAEQEQLFWLYNSRADVQTVAERIAARGGERL